MIRRRAVALPEPGRSTDGSEGLQDGQGFGGIAEVEAEDVVQDFVLAAR